MVFFHFDVYVCVVDFLAFLVATAANVRVKMLNLRRLLRWRPFGVSHRLESNHEKRELKKVCRKLNENK